MTPADFPAERLTKHEVFYLKSLRKKNERKGKQLFVIEGKNLCFEALKANCNIELIVYDISLKEEFEPILFEARIKSIPAKIASPKQFNQFSATATPPGIAAVIVWKEMQYSTGIIRNYKRLLLLDSVSDPGNLGTLLRTAEWFNIRGIICNKQSAEITNPKVVRGSMGALFYLTIWENMSLVKIIPELKLEGFSIIGTDLRIKNNVTQKDISFLRELSRSALVLGSEAHGISPEILEQCDYRIAIPSYGNSESLNVGVAGGILMYYLAMPS